MRLKSNGSKRNSTVRPARWRIDLVEVALQREGGIAAHLALLAPQEGPAQRFRVHGADLVQAGGVAGQRGLAGFGVLVLVIDALEPGPQRFVEFGSGW